MRYLAVLLALSAMLARPADAQTPGYTTPKPFMDVFFDFTGSDEPDYPAGQPTMGQMLTQAEAAKDGPPGPLVIIAGSGIYAYDATTGQRIVQDQFRADRTNGFFELTAISHIGPALAYLAQIKAGGDDRWKSRLASLATHVAAVRALNLQARDNWLDQVNQAPWASYKPQIRAMVDYACARTLDYIASLGDGAALTADGVNQDFLKGKSAKFPIPFQDVMIATFMLDALRGAVEVHGALAAHALNWPRAMVLVSSRAGSNVSSGLTEGTNWLVYFLKAASGFTLPDTRIKIVPYAETRPSLGQAVMVPADLS